MSGQESTCHQNALYYEALQLMHIYGLVDAVQDQLLALLAPARGAFEKLYPDEDEAARRFQLFMAINLGYAQMSITEFIPASLHDNRDALMTSLDELLEFYREGSAR